MPRQTLREQVASLTEQLNAERNNVELLQENVTTLELAMEDYGWQRLVAVGQQEFTRQGLQRITDVSRIFGTKNPLVKRALTLKQVYVWGQGVDITARANGRRSRAGEQDVNSVIQAFLDDPGNRRAFTGVDAQLRLERALGTDGNLFLSLWTRPATGKVQVRVLPWDEIGDIIHNPDDSSEPWFYRRRWLETRFDPISGDQPTQQREALYPALNYRPKSRPSMLGGIDVRWDAPVRHVKVNDLEGWRYGIGDVYAALDWARAYKEFLEDWARLVKSLSKFAWRATATGQAQAKAIRAKTSAPPNINPLTGQLDNVGATAIVGVGQNLEAIPKSGAMINADSGKPLAGMVAASVGVPITMLLSDPGHSGARAVAKTLDQPTELEMESRRNLWSEVLRDLCAHVVTESVRAPKGALKGVIVADPDTNTETVTLAGDTEQTIDIGWSDLKDLAAADVVAAIVAAASTMTMPPEITLRQLLTALGIKNTDEVVDAMVDDDGDFLWPEAPPIAPGKLVAPVEPNTEPGVDGEEPAGGEPGDES